MGWALRYFEKDDSYSWYPTAILMADLKWRWAAAKGLPYAEDFRAAEEMITNMMGREPAPTLCLTMSRGEVASPAILVPSGTWELP